jgi:DNA-directed RNA polymerase subunit beta
MALTIMHTLLVVHGPVDTKINATVNNLMHNYKIKENDLQGALRREKFTISVGDELPAGNLKTC